MTAHERLMRALYDAVTEAGSGITRTQMMRLAQPTITALRGTRSSWDWITARIEHVRSHGIEEVMPSETEVDTALTGRPLGPVRATYVRLVREQEETKAKAVVKHQNHERRGEMVLSAESARAIAADRLPMIRAGPEELAQNLSPSSSPTADGANSARGDSAVNYLNSLAKLTKAAT
jgi:hypothetical protein